MKKIIAIAGVLSVAVALAIGSASLLHAATPQGNTYVAVPPQVQSSNLTDLFQDIPQGIPSAQSVYISLTNLRSAILGSAISHNGTPTLTSCVTGSGTIVGTDYAFILTGGSTASTSCVATFAVAYATTPVCIVASQTAPGTTTPSYTVSTTAVTITQASNSSEVYDVVCIAQPGG